MQPDRTIVKSFKFNADNVVGQVLNAENSQNANSVDLSKIAALLNLDNLDFQPVDIAPSEQVIFDYANVQSQRAEKTAEKAKSHDAKRQAQQNIQSKVEEEKREEAQKMDQQYAELLSAEDNAKIEADKKQQEEIQRKDEQAFTLMNEFPHIEYQMAYKMLGDRNWNFQAVSNDLRAQRSKQEKEDQDRESKVMQVMERCDDLFDFDVIKRMLMAANWDVARVVQQHKDAKVQANMVEMVLVDCADPNSKQPLQLDKNADGMAIIQHLISIKPLSGQNGSAAYNIYKDAGKQQCINYLQLSSNVESLGIQYQPKAQRLHPLTDQARILYYAQDAEMKWD